MSGANPASANPRFAAQHIAKLLDEDAVMAGLVKEYINPERLQEVLGLPLVEGPIPEFGCLDAAFPGIDISKKIELMEPWQEEVDDYNSDSP